MTTTITSIAGLIDFLDRLKAARIHYGLSDPTDGAIMVSITVPGERWEVEVLADGQFRVEVFRSRGGVEGAEAIDELFRRFSD